MINVPNLRHGSQNFSNIEMEQIQRSTFDRSHKYTTALDPGYLYPILADEILPGDTIKYSPHTLARLMTPIVPFMDSLRADIHVFFVPYRQLWTNFVKMMGEQDTPGDSTTYTVPKITTTPTTGFVTGSIHDYLGLPVGQPNMSLANAWWHRAYNAIWNRYYRDEDLQNPATINTGNGPDAASDYALKRRNVGKDYFTSARPWPQKGTAATLPLAGTAKVYGEAMSSATGSRGAHIWQLDDGLGSTSFNRLEGVAGTGVADWAGTFAAKVYSALGTKAWYDANPSTTAKPPYVDFSTGTITTTINDLRYSIAVQQMLERDARGGTRYAESVYNQFGVTQPSLLILQYPEYLGSVSADLNMAAIPQTSSTDATTPQGNLAAMGVFTHNPKAPIVHSFQEHGVLLALLSIIAPMTYQYGLHKKFTRSTRYDYYTPALANLGEQAIKNEELYVTGTPATDAAAFGYQERWSELRYFPGQITGILRSHPSTGTSLDLWHLAPKYTSLPTSDLRSLSRTLQWHASPQSRHNRISK